MRKRAIEKVLRVVVFGAAVAACSEPTTSSPAARPRGISSAASNGAPLDVPEVRMDRPPHPRPWDTSNVALAAAIAAQDGHAVVGFKEAGSRPALETGLRAAVTAATIKAGLALLRARGAEILTVYSAIGAAHVRMPPAIASELRSNPLFDYVEPRQYRWLQGSSLGSTPASKLSSAFLAQTVPWGVQLVQAPSGWPTSRGTGARIELIDTGMDTTHEDLPHPPATNCAGAFDGCRDAFPFPHGSHVIGIWTARDNAVGVIGVAPGINTTDVFAYGACSDQDGHCPTPEIITGINAGIFDAKVINMSFGGSTYDAGEANAVASAWNNDIVLVAAAGNLPGVPAGSVVYPAGYTNVIGVSGVKTDKSFASSSPCPGSPSSNYGSHVDLAAPFWAKSTVPGGYQDETSGWCGTSMSTPHVSGVAALVRAARPSWTNQQVVTRLVNMAEDLGTVGRDNYFGNGLVNAYRALTTTLSISGPGFISQKGTYTFTAAYSRFNTTPTFFWEEKQCSTCAWVHVGGSTATYTRTLSPNCNQGWDVEHLRTTATDSWGMSNTSTKDVYLCEQP